MERNYTIREAVPSEYRKLGEITVSVYEQLAGMPGASEQPEYYAMLYDVKTRAQNPWILHGRCTKRWDLPDQRIWISARGNWRFSDSV